MTYNDGMATTTQPQLDEITRTIRSQLGNAAMTMLGAQNFGAGVCTTFGPYLRFNIKGCRRANLVVVYLTPGRDTYRVATHRVTGLDVYLHLDADGVHAEQLAAVIGRMTNLAVSL